jgi:hypothetical protein
MNRTSILSHSRKLAILCLALTLSVMAVTLSTAGVASAATTAAQWKLWQLDRDRCWDAATMDANFNGNAEDLRFDIDNDCRWDTRIWNSVGGDHFAESMTYDMNEDGRWEFWLADTNQREGFDVVYFDDNRDGYYDRWAYLATAASRTLRDAILDNTVVGGAPQYDGLAALGLTLARFTGRAYLPAGDWDRDGRADDSDRCPSDPRC